MRYICSVLSAMWEVGVFLIICGLLSASFEMAWGRTFMHLSFFLGGIGCLGLFILCLLDNSIRNRSNDSERSFWNNLLIKRLFFRQGIFLEIYRLKVIGNYPEDYPLRSKLAEFTRAIVPKFVFVSYYYMNKYLTVSFLMVFFLFSLALSLRLDLLITASAKLCFTLFFVWYMTSIPFSYVALDDILRKENLDMEDFDEYLYKKYVKGIDKN